MPISCTCTLPPTPPHPTGYTLLLRNTTQWSVGTPVHCQLLWPGNPMHCSEIHRALFCTLSFSFVQEEHETRLGSTLDFRPQSFWIGTFLICNSTNTILYCFLSLSKAAQTNHAEWKSLTDSPQEPIHTKFNFKHTHTHTHTNTHTHTSQCTMSHNDLETP